MTSPNWTNRTMRTGANLDISEEDALAVLLALNLAEGVS